MGADPLQGCRVPAQRKGKQEASAASNSRIQEPCLYTFKTVMIDHGGVRKLQGECFPGELFSIVGRAEGPRDGVEELGLCSCKEWRNGGKGWDILKEKW